MYNLQKMRKLVINGAYTHPGANIIEDKNSNRIILGSQTKSQREALAKTLLRIKFNLFK